MPERYSEAPKAVIRERTEEALDFGFDAVIVHGKNWRRYPLKVRVKNRFDQLVRGKDPLPLRLSKDSRLSALGIGELYRTFTKEGKTPPVFIFSTGKTAGPQHPSEAQAMVDYMKVRYPEIPDENIVLEDNSYDTVGNINESKRIIEERGFRNVGYVTIGYHVPRVQLLMDYYDAPINVIFPSQEWAANRSPRHARFVEAYKDSKQWRNHTIGEQILIGEMIPDRGQKIMSATLAKFIRHQ